MGKSIKAYLSVEGINASRSDRSFVIASTLRCSTASRAAVSSGVTSKGPLVYESVIIYTSYYKISTVT